MTVLIADPLNQAAITDLEKFFGARSNRRSPPPTNSNRHHPVLSGDLNAVRRRRRKKPRPGQTEVSAESLHDRGIVNTSSPGFRERAAISTRGHERAARSATASRRLYHTPICRCSCPPVNLGIKVSAARHRGKAPVPTAHRSKSVQGDRSAGSTSRLSTREHRDSASCRRQTPVDLDLLGFIPPIASGMRAMDQPSGICCHRPTGAVRHHALCLANT